MDSAKQEKQFTRAPFQVTNLNTKKKKYFGIAEESLKGRLCNHNLSFGNELKNPEALIDCSQTIDCVYANLEDYNQLEKNKVLIVFDDMIADMESNKNGKRYC